MGKIVAYLRVSTNKQELANQKMAVLEFANREGLQNVQFVERVISSRRKEQKTHLDGEISKLRAGDLLIVAELSRVGRSLGQIITLIDELTKRKIGFIAIKENIRLEEGKRDATSTAVIGMFGVLAELERNLISERTKDGLRRAKASGKKLGRPKGTRGKSKLDGKEKEIAGYLDKKVSKASICKIMGVTAPTLDHFIKSRELEVGGLLKGIT